ncbi:MAG TPA: DUF1444 family protein [Tepidisphaeraceae bacterium]|jgi:hypothetical protein
MPDVTREKFAQQVIDIVRSRFPLVKLARAEKSFSLRLNGRTASLENLFRLYKLAPDEFRRQVERWAVELLRDSEGTPDRFADFETVQERLLPMLVSAELAELRSADIVTQPIVEGLAVTYVLDGDRTIAYLPHEVLKRWKKTPEDLHEIALANLVARSQSIQAHAAQDDDGSVSLVVFQTLDGFDATRLLLPTLHSRLREVLGSPFAAAIPNRDILLCFRSGKDTVAQLTRQVAQDFRTMPHQVTDKLFLVTADGIAPLSATPA